MNLTSKKAIKNQLKNYQIQPSRGLGQNFLIDRGVVKKVIEAANLKPNDVVLEIGPGFGALTIELAKFAKKIVAAEKDPSMTRILNNELRIMEIKNVEIVQSDILKINPKAYNLKPKTYKIVTNLPFYLTAPVIRKFLESDCQPKEMILMVQKEVGQRICAKPPDMNLLAVSVQIYAEAKIINYVSKKSFWPQPKVDSALIRITPLINADRKLINADLFFKIVKAGFSQPRKQIINNFSQKLKIDKKKVGSWLLKNNIQPIQRAETLDIEDWIKLTENFVSSINFPY
ncbi:MAG: ribosomal RNA small subunit methyltransferase A [Candidatus Nealsonbacteria bacterium CG02_land_8_20_14_3_00_37_10]|uniref:Ribosomal RNA small subunit methyltransferase A n=1 Tax=Candidatus Nealsonbacteria bacterium CG02_land_8_20_14_3_00_37_10 TaxID=1974699 RepID=A0A2M7DA76_9BACT|nr:MAG: ribosomal RNA small subunit methyltransferase A [Candidatus Nealsonbacteria bacterium CG02_land_8_20_14_3_00_37_10]